MYPVFYVEAGDTLPIHFDTFDGGTGASITASGLAVTDIEIYKDGSTTQRASDNGYALLDTDGLDFDGVTGVHGFSIDLSDNSDSGFYTVGPWYYVVVSTITVDGQTVSFIAAAFRIVSATRGLAGTALPDAAADASGGLPISDAGGLDLDNLLDVAVSSRLAPTTAGRTLDVAATGEAGVDLGNVTGTLTNANVGWVDGSNRVAGIQGTKNTLDDLNDVSAADVNSQVVDVLRTDTTGEPGQAAPPATTDLQTKIDYLYKAWRNKKDNDGSTTQLYADDGSTVDQKQSTTEAGGTVTKAEWVTGP